MKRITTAQLIELIKEIKGATMATITISTEPSNMRKTDNPFAGLIRKLATHMVCINYSYENAVNKQREREENFDDAPFVAGENWGQHISPAIIENKGQHYLQVKLQKTLSEAYVNQSNGSIVDKAELTPYMREKAPNVNQLVDKEIINIRPKFENIVEIAIKGEKYQVVK